VNRAEKDLPAVPNFGSPVFSGVQDLRARKNDAKRCAAAGDDDPLTPPSNTVNFAAG